MVFPLDCSRATPVLLIFFSRMKLKRTCQFNGKIYEMDFPNMTASQYYDAREKWKGGLLIQQAFPFLNADEREFIMTGTPPNVWNEIFGEAGL